MEGSSAGWSGRSHRHRTPRGSRAETQSTGREPLGQENRRHRQHPSDMHLMETESRAARWRAQRTGWEGFSPRAVGTTRPRLLRRSSCCLRAALLRSLSLSGLEPRILESSPSSAVLLSLRILRLLLPVDDELFVLHRADDPHPSRALPPPQNVKMSSPRRAHTYSSTSDIPSPSPSSYEPPYSVFGTA
ncbi:hypothetical protein VTN02DRAFT_3298 [Thermoascus thermophilus]